MPPIPTPDKAERFRKIYLSETDVVLTDAEALEVSMCVLQITYARQYALEGGERWDALERLLVADLYQDPAPNQDGESSG